MDRIEQLRRYIDDILINKGPEDMRDGFVHLYGVALAAAILARKRGLNEEIAVISGMLHDISTYQYVYTKDHAAKGAVMAKEILTNLNLAHTEEIETITQVISLHSDKKNDSGNPYAELLKDADVMHHCLYHPGAAVSKKEEKRFLALSAELGFASP